MVEFLVSEDEAARFLDHLRQHPVRLFYARIPATFGILNPDRADPSAAS